MSTIKLGLLAPLSGLVKLYGQEICWAAQLAVEEINTHGGILGKPVELIIEDDGSLPESAVPAALRLVNEHHCVAIIGNLLSNSRIAVAAQVSEPLKIPHLNFSFYEGGIYHPYFFSFSALPNQQINKMVPYMAEKFGPKFYFVGNNYEWPRGSIDAAKRSLQSFGGETVGEEYFDFGTEDFSELLQRVKHSGADVFVPYAAGMDQIQLLTQFTDSGLKERMTVVMGHYDEAMVSSISPNVRQGFYSVNSYFMSVDTPENKRYLEQLRQRDEITGIWPNGNGKLTNFGEGTYVCVKAFAQAANQAGSVSADTLAKALEKVTLSCPQGRVQMDAQTHHAWVNCYLSQCKPNGEFGIIEKFGLIPPQIPDRYRDDIEDIAPSPPKTVIMPKLEHWELYGLVNYSPDQNDGKNFSHLEVSAQKNLFSQDDFLNFLRLHHHRFFESAGTTQPFLIHEPFTDGASEEYYIRISPVYLENQCRHFIIHTALERRQLCSTDSNKLASAKHLVPHSGQQETPTGQISADAISEMILAIADTAILATDQDGNIVRTNKVACDLFGYSVSELMGFSIHMLLPPNLRSAHKQHFHNFLSSPVSISSMGTRGELTGYKKDGSFFPAEASICKFIGNEGPILVATIRDITEHKLTEDKLIWQATHDKLTKLPNRHLLEERLQNALNRSENTNHNVAVLFVDMDSFKLINDTYGHETGDQLLLSLASRLVSAIRPGDTIARFGGDEFVILCDQIHDAETVTNIADNIITALKNPLDVNGSSHYVTVSIGIAFGHGTHTKTDAMLRNADAAMYAAKYRGRDGWEIYTDTIGENSKTELIIANGLREALQHNEFELYYQPIVSSHNGLIVGAEALIRWHSKNGPVSPAVFIPIAEMTGTITTIGLWVLEQACTILAELSQNQIHLPYMSVNLSARQLNDRNLVFDIEKILHKTGASAHNLVLEITESALLHDVEVVIDILKELGKLGIRVAIDDFGTGYSSLGQLIRLPVHTLKVDRIFVNNIETEVETRSVMAAIVKMAQELGLKVTAEGVETMEQLRVVKSLGCQACQGYLFYKPMPGNVFISTLKTQQLKQA